MSGFVLWLIYGLPWQLQALIVLAIACAGLWVVGLVFGWAVVRKIAAPVIGLVGVLLYAQKMRQQGYDDRRAEEEKALDYAEEIVADEKADVQRLPDVELDEETDRWTRKDKR